MTKSFVKRSLAVFILGFTTAGPTMADQKATSPTTRPAPLSPPYVSDDGNRRPIPIVGIENVCAWPKLVALKDGGIAAIIFNQPSHGRMIGGVDCWASADGGLTWTKRATAVPPDAGVQHTRMNHAAGLAGNGDLVVIVGGWTLYPKPNQHGPYEVDKLLRPCVSRSSDGGFTWKTDKHAFPETAPDGQTFVPFGSIARNADGSLLVSAYVVGGKVYVLRSDDDGRTWDGAVRIQTTLKPSETTLLTDGKGRILAASRTRTLEVFESIDAGKSWTHLSRASDDLGIPGDLRFLADGLLLVTHGNRKKGMTGIDARVSRDGGRTWSEPRRVADFISDGGYPSSVQRGDGMVVTAFYARKTEERDGYQMGITIWDPVKTFDGVPDVTFQGDPSPRADTNPSTQR